MDADRSAIIITIAIRESNICFPRSIFNLMLSFVTHSHMSGIVSCPYSSISRGEAMELLRRWFVEDKGTLNVSQKYVQYSGHSK